ncbi:hypothetical protein MTsPCn5_16540 [Croceitalea sp. MTPC5]|nr:hypothetical protein MTsPCn5_16540 [Croceitalea sp. MTPC5]
MIWGIIGVKIFSALSPNEQENAPMKEVTFTKVTTLKRDTFSIVADYRDPFLGTLPKKKSLKKPIIKKKEVQKRNVTYTGSIIDNNSKNSVFFIAIEGEQVLLKNGQTHEGVTLLKGTAKSIRIRYSGVIETIQLQQ